MSGSQVAYHDWVMLQVKHVGGLLHKRVLEAGVDALGRLPLVQIWPGRLTNDLQACQIVLLLCCESDERPRAARNRVIIGMKFVLTCCKFNLTGRRNQYNWV